METTRCNVVVVCDIDTVSYDVSGSCLTRLFRVRPGEDVSPYPVASIITDRDGIRFGQDQHARYLPRYLNYQKAAWSIPNLKPSAGLKLQ